jgi:hypothetical protein
MYIDPRGEAAHRHPVVSQDLAELYDTRRPVPGLYLKALPQGVLHRVVAHIPYQGAQLVQGLGFPGFGKNRKTV